MGNVLWGTKNPQKPRARIKEKGQERNQDPESISFHTLTTLPRRDYRSADRCTDCPKGDNHRKWGRLGGQHKRQLFRTPVERINRCRSYGSRWHQRQHCTWGTYAAGCHSVFSHTQNRRHESTLWAQHPFCACYSMGRSGGPARQKHYSEGPVHCARYVKRWLKMKVLPFLIRRRWFLQCKIRLRCQSTYRRCQILKTWLK